MIVLVETNKIYDDGCKLRMVMGVSYPGPMKIGCIKIIINVDFQYGSLINLQFHDRTRIASVYITFV